MRKFIDNKMYDSDNANAVLYSANLPFINDFRYLERTLSLTSCGSWFVYSKGGAMTELAEVFADGTRSTGETIEAISADEAFAFLRDRNAIDEIKRFFPDRVTA